MEPVVFWFYLALNLQTYVCVFFLYNCLCAFRKKNLWNTLNNTINNDFLVIRPDSNYACVMLENISLCVIKIEIDLEASAGKK